MHMSTDTFCSWRPSCAPVRRWRVVDLGGPPAALDATDKDVEVGGAGLAAQAIELGLVDELRMFRNPVVVGGGTPFLPPVTDDIALDLIETRTFGSRVIYERYGRARDESGSPWRCSRSSPGRPPAAA